MDRYWGDDFSPLHTQRLVLATIPAALRRLEAGLRQRRWFDYRLMDSAQATYYFAHCYRQQYQQAYAATRDVDGAANVSPFAGDDVFASREAVSFFKARQAADHLGCRYSFFLRCAFDELPHRGWRYLPRPNHLLDLELVAFIAERWKAERAASLQLADDERLKANAPASPERAAYQQWLISEVKRRKKPDWVLARLVFAERHLPESIAQAEFGVTILAQARQHALLYAGN